MNEWNDIYEPQDWGQLEMAARVRFSDAHRRRLIEALREYVLVPRAEDRPRTKEVRLRIKTLAGAAEKTAAALSRRDPEGRAVVDRVWPWGQAPDPYVVQELLREVATRALQLQGKVQNDNRGRPAAVGLRAFVCAVRDTWQEAGGDGRGVWRDQGRDEHYSGPLLELITALVASQDLPIPAFRTVAKYVTETRKRTH